MFGQWLRTVDEQARGDVRQLARSWLGGVIWLQRTWPQAFFEDVEKAMAANGIHCTEDLIGFDMKFVNPATIPDAGAAHLMVWPRRIAGCMPPLWVEC